MASNDKLIYLIRYLIGENSQYANIIIPSDSTEQFNLFRSLVNVRPPKPISRKFLDVQDEFLKEIISKKGITKIEDLHPICDDIYLWKGDITTLQCGAIVNASNSQMLGCFNPCHGCIDNAIHTFSGVQLRLECAKIMTKQGHEEPTGQAKITSAYNLPSNYIIHTVGPIVDNILTQRHRKLLESCYSSCLEMAVNNNIDSVAFCCISTGVFGFPQEEASKIAIQTVKEFLKHDKVKVIFNVFQQDDYEIYRRLLG